jgi:hypothetical protein
VEIIIIRESLSISRDMMLFQYARRSQVGFLHQGFRVRLFLAGKVDPLSLIIGLGIGCLVLAVGAALIIKNRKE